uniref:Ataxin 7-like 2 n=1 Tax=Cyclopterus lumpus TaxID=8103 RepID=A0A8C2Z3X1_CYCLU
MAALDRQNPNLDDFVGLNWSCWVERVNILPSDDMHTFGRCPSHDEISLVVCSHCGQVVKPQAFEKHCERRHGPLTKTCGQSSSASQQRLRPARPLANHSSSRQKQKDTRGHGASAHSSAVSPVHQHRPSKAQQEAVRYCLRLFISWQHTEGQLFRFRRCLTEECGPVTIPFIL